jgi:hypothetical protein
LVSPPGPLLTPLDNYKCYRVRGANFRRENINVETQFGALALSVKRPYQLCVPADVDNHPVVDDVLTLMCYQVRSAPQAPQEVYTHQQLFGPDQYDIYGVRELCVPSILFPGECGDGTVNDFDEQCDPLGPNPTCESGVCGNDCMCAEPTCGDDVVNQLSEECDGSAATCGLDDVCNDDCLCEPLPVCSIEGGASAAKCTCTNQQISCTAPCDNGLSCDERRLGCVTYCTLNGGGPGNCATTPCTDCDTGLPCQ